MALVIKQTFQK